MFYTIMTGAAVRSAHNEALLEAHHNIGERRRDVIPLMNSLGKDAAFAVRFGRSIASVAGDGQLSAGGLGGATEVGVSAPLQHPLPGAVPGAKRVKGLTIPYGVCLIVGAGGSGKTPLAHALAAHDREEYGAVRIGEPLAGYSTGDQAASTALVDAMYHHDSVVVDSIKDLLAGGGAAMRSGISRDSLVVLSEWSTIACNVGCTLYVPVNPSTGDDEVLELLGEAARSNATSTIIHKGSRNWEYFGRTGEGLDRVRADLRFESTDIEVVGDSVATSSVARTTTAIVSSLQPFSSVIRRSMISNED